MLTVNSVYYEGSKIQPIHISLDNIGATIKGPMKTFSVTTAWCSNSLPFLFPCSCLRPPSHRCVVLWSLGLYLMN